MCKKYNLILFHFGEQECDELAGIQGFTFVFFFACGFVVLAESIGQICRLVELGKFPHNISFLLACQYYFSRLATILLPQIFANFTGESDKSQQ